MSKNTVSQKMKNEENVKNEQDMQSKNKASSSMNGSKNAKDEDEAKSCKSKADKVTSGY